MERTLPALPCLLTPPRLRSCKLSRVSPLCLLQRPPLCQLRAKSSLGGAVEIRWRELMGSTPCPSRVVCLFGGGNGKGKQGADDSAQGAARKALEKALGGKRSAFSKWEETQKREADVGGGGGGRWGRGWFGGGGWEGFFDFDDDEDGWEEVLQVTLAFLTLCFVYGMICAPRGVSYFLAYITVNSVVYILNKIIYYSWWLRMKALGYTPVEVKSKPVYESRSPKPYQPEPDDAMDEDDWDEY